MQKSIMLLRVLGLCFLVSGCSLMGSYIDGDQAPSAVKKRFTRYRSAEACKSHHGEWRRVSDPSVFKDGGYCLLKTSDAGQDCTSSSDCESYCELSSVDSQDNAKPKCASTMPPRWDRCNPGYYENGKVLNRGECFGEDSEVQ